MFLNLPDVELNDICFVKVKEPGFKEYDGNGIIFGVNNTTNEYYVFYLRKDRPLLDEILSGENLIFLDKKDNHVLIKKNDTINLIKKINIFLSLYIFLIPPDFKSIVKTNENKVNKKIEKININVPFMGSYIIEDLSICDDLMYYYNCQKKNNNTTPGYIGSENMKHGVNLHIKHSFDTPMTLCNDDINLNKISKKYLDYLQNILNLYINEYPFCDSYSKYGLDKNINIQYYPKNGGYKQYHTERTNLNYPIVFRHLVFMTYLNDITDRGETEFFHQKIKVKPKKGLTLIWPADWTFTHRGIPSPTQEKYIVTGWYNFIPRN